MGSAGAASSAEWAARSSPSEPEALAWVLLLRSAGEWIAAAVARFAATPPCVGQHATRALVNAGLGTSANATDRVSRNTKTVVERVAVAVRAVKTVIHLATTTIRTEAIATGTQQ